MIKIYGTDQCRYCIACKKDLDDAGIVYEYKDIQKELAVLKEFMFIRDKEDGFETVKGKGVGVPCIIREDGSITFDWKEFLTTV